MRQYLNSSLRAQVIFEELLYIVAMLSLIIFTYNVAKFVEDRAKVYVCYVSLNEFLREFQKQKDFFGKFEYLEIVSEEYPIIYRDGERICGYYGGKSCCYYIDEDLNGYLSGKIIYDEGSFKLL